MDPIVAKTTQWPIPKVLPVGNRPHCGRFRTYYRFPIAVVREATNFPLKWAVDGLTASGCEARKHALAFEIDNSSRDEPGHRYLIVAAL